MARQGRLHVPGATYFVVDRIATDLDVLVAGPRRHLDSSNLRRLEANRKRFETLLDYVCRRWCARVHAYCWLPDSALLLVQVSQVPLEFVLHSLRGSFSHFLRTRTGSSQRPYGDRYRALLIDPEEFFLDFVRHIFWSPVNAGLCSSPIAYDYSNARVCIGESAPPFLYTATLAEALAARGFSSRAGFMRFLSLHPTGGFLAQVAHGAPHDPRIAGSQLFVQEMRHRLRMPAPRIDLDVVISWVSARLGVAVDKITGESRYHLGVEARALVAWLATTTASASLPEVAKRLSCSPSALHRAIRHYLRLRPALFSCETSLQFQNSIGMADEDGREPAG